MKFVRAALALSGCTVIARGGGTANVLGKVLELIDSLAAKVVADGEAEGKAFKENF